MLLGLAGSLVPRGGRALISAPRVANVRGRWVVSRGRGPRSGRSLPEVVAAVHPRRRAAYAPCPRHLVAVSHVDGSGARHRPRADPDLAVDWVYRRQETLLRRHRGPRRCIWHSPGGGHGL